MTGTWWGDLLVSIALALALIWLVLILAMVIVKPQGAHLTAALRLPPDVLRLIRRLAVDKDLPRGVRVRLGLVLAYLALPIDIIPDVIPVLGYADDAIIVTAILRSVVRRAGPAAIRRHWPGSDEGFSTLCRLTGLPEHGPDA